jgi:hypothetical protein
LRSAYADRGRDLAQFAATRCQAFNLPRQELIRPNQHNGGVMSEKKRQKKDGRDKNKKNQAMREGQRSSSLRARDNERANNARTGTPDKPKQDKKGTRADGE